MIIDRRQTTRMLLGLAGGSALGPALSPLAARAQDGAREGVTRAFGSSLVGTPRHDATMTHFDYANPDAPKGGRARLATIGAFDSFNPFIVKGNVGAGFNLFGGLIYDELMTNPLDEDSTSYGSLVEWIEWPKDYSSVVFKIRDEARWHDGEPITPEDVIFAYQQITTVGRPFYRAYYENVEKAEALPGNLLRFAFDQTDNRELPHIMAQVPVLPKHWWQDRAFDESSLEAPLGSGPYKVGRFEANTFCEFERVEDWWGRDLPVNRGAHNFDTLRFEYFKDPNAAFDAFKAGQVDFRAENSSLNWGTRYDFPALERGDVVKRAVELDGPKTTQSFAFNTRRPLFKDRRVREALGMAFDFEWLNKAIFFDSYARPSSYFQGTDDLMAEGLPEGRELELLEEHRDALPPELFTEPYTLPVTDGSGRPDRRALRKAKKLLADAGWTVKQGKLVNEAGEPFVFEFMIGSGAQERVVAPFVKNLERLGIDATIRLVDSSQYASRYRAFDFDMVVGQVANSASPGNEQRDFWGSAVAEQVGGRNTNGVSDPVVDALIESIVFSEDRADLAAASRALDRVLLWGHYNILQLYTPTARIAWWQGEVTPPDPLPSHAVGFPTVWWDPEAEA